MTHTRGTILVVDDDPDFSASVATFLRVQGYEVLQARGGRQGLELARRHPPDLILMDIMMGERTEGLFTVRQIRRDPALERIPIFVVSSLYTDLPGFRIRPEQGWMGHDEFFPKPVDLDRLLACVEAHLAGSAAPGGEVGR
jgi:DNA-binding response OmpR family regulator